jgi:hypothetical protein
MSSKSSSDNESKKGGVKAKKPKSSKKSGLKSKKPVKKSGLKSKKPKSPKKKSSKRGGSHGYAQMFKSSLSPCYEGVEKTSWHGGNQRNVPASASDAMNQALFKHQINSTIPMDTDPQLGPAEFAATGNESPLQDAKGEVPGYFPSDFGPAPVEPVPDGKRGGAGKKKKTSSKKKSVLGKTKNFLSSLLSKTKSVVKKSANFVKSKVSGDKKKKSTKKSVKKSTTTDKKKKAKKSVKKDK